MAGANRFVDAKIRQRKVMLFAKRGDPYCRLVREVLDLYNMEPADYEVCEIDRRQDCTQIENHFLVICLASSRRVPRLFIDGRYVGSDPIDINRFHEDGSLHQLLQAAGVETRLKYGSVEQTDDFMGNFRADHEDP